MLPADPTPRFDRLHLKLYYLRTRVRREAQGLTARQLDVRPATISCLEQGRSLPTLPMLLVLCHYYNVTPNYLLDDERPIEPQLRDRWSDRDAVITRGDWIEVPEGSVIRTADGALLCPVLGGARYYEPGAQAERMLCASKADAERLDATMRGAARARDERLEHELGSELLGQRKSRPAKARPRGRSGGRLTPDAAD